MTNILNIISKNNIHHNHPLCITSRRHHQLEIQVLRYLLVMIMIVRIIVVVMSMITLLLPMTITTPGTIRISHSCFSFHKRMMNTNEPITPLQSSSHYHNPYPYPHSHGTYTGYFFFLSVFHPTK